MSNVRITLFPFSILYDGITRVRNFLYDSSVLKSIKFPVPVIVIGNLSVGGTGKTPHTELVASIVKTHRKTAVLSRGYGRKTKGYQLATPSSTAQEIGDEPLQIFNTVEDIDVAVCEDRAKGVRQLIDTRQTQVVVLDDAFQHRKIKGSLYILLSTYNRMFYTDWVLPAGNLRETAANKSRADIIIVTKCPTDLSAQKHDKIIRKIKPTTQQHIFFSYIEYGTPISISGNADFDLAKNIVLVTGIVQPKPLQQHLEKQGKKVTPLTFPDHYHYTAKDVRRIEQELKKLGNNTIVATTSKDAVKLQPLLKNYHFSTFEIPIKVGFLFGQKNEFTKIIENHVRKV